MGERDVIALIDGVHHLVKAPMALVWDRLNTHISHAMRGLIAEREQLTVFLLPAYSPDLNPVAWVWAPAKRSLANLTVVALDRLEALVRDRLKRLQYRPRTLDGFIAGTGLILDVQRHLDEPESVIRPRRCMVIGSFPVGCRSLSEGAHQCAKHCRAGMPPDLSDLLPSPGPECGAGRAVVLSHQGCAERRLVVGEQLLLQTVGEAAVGHIRVDHDLGDREDVPGRGELLEVLRQCSVEPLPPCAVTLDGEPEDAPLQSCRLGDQHVESWPPDVFRQAVQEALPAAVLLAGRRARGLH
jgi:hypothetical protein